MGLAESVVPSSGNVVLDSIVRNAVVQTAVQGMIDAAAQNAASNLVERQKTTIRELEERFVQEIQTLERTVSNMRQQNTATEMKLLEMQQLEESVKKLEKRFGDLEISIKTIRTIIPEAKAVVEMFLKQIMTTTEVPNQTPRVDISSGAANASISTSSSSTPAMTIRCDVDTTNPGSESTQTSKASGCTNPAFNCKSYSSAPVPTFQTNGTPPVHEFASTFETTFSSALPNPALEPTAPSSAPASSIQTNDTRPVREFTPASKTTFSSVRPNPALESTAPSSAPASSIQTNDTHPVREFTPASKTTFSSVRPNPALESTAPSSAPASSIQTNDTHPVREFTPASKTTFSSVRPNPALESTAPSSAPASLIETNDTPPVAESTTFSTGNSELPRTSAAKNILPPAFSGSKRADSPLSCTSFNESTPAGRNAQSATEHQCTALPGTAISSPSVVFPESQRKKSKRAFYKNKIAETKFLKAVEKGKVEVVRRLMEENVNINSYGREGMTAAHLAAWRGDAVVLELLLRGGALVQRRDWYDWQPLHWAAKRDRGGRCVELLLAAGAPLYARTRPEGHTPLHLAALEGNEAAAAALLRAGAEVAVRNKMGETPLDLAPSTGQMRKMLGAE